MHVVADMITKKKSTNTNKRSIARREEYSDIEYFSLFFICTDKKILCSSRMHQAALTLDSDGVML